MPIRFLIAGLLLLLPSLAPAADPVAPGSAAFARQFDDTVRPFVQAYCVSCHGEDSPDAELNLAAFTSLESVVADFDYWALVMERLEAAEMPPSKAEKFPSAESRHDIIAWISALRRHEASRNAGDPGPVLARRLNNAEYDYTIRDLTGVDIRPTREFPIDPANQAGFDNSGESLAMSPALLKKYLHAARTVAEHLILKPDGFAFAPHPVVADTDRDKFAVLRIVDFYRRQPTDYADYFFAAWQHQHRAALGRPTATLAAAAAAAKVSPKYLAAIWSTLTSPVEEVGPIARLQQAWRRLPSPNAGTQTGIGVPSSTIAIVRQGTEAMRDFVLGLRQKLVPVVENLTAPSTGIQNGSQTLVMWKNRQMAANRRRYDPAALQVEGAAQPATVSSIAEVASPAAPAAPSPPSPTPAAVRLGGEFLAPTVVTTGSSATFQMAGLKDRGTDPDLLVPADADARARHEAAFARFAAVFPDAFYITERARVYLDAEREQKLAGRLLSAGLHSMTGFFRDDGPLYDLVLDDAGRQELDRLWREFEFASSVPQRMHISFVWFERTDSSFMRDPEFDPYRPEDKTVTDQVKIRELAELYLEKARRNDASEPVQAAIREHFEIVAATIRQVEEDRRAAEPSHLQALAEFAATAWRRPLTASERQRLVDFYRVSREENGVDHEEAMRDSIMAVLMSPHFCYRIDLGGDDDAIGLTQAEPAATGASPDATQPLTGDALASRLSYFLWSSLPDTELRAHAAQGDLHRPGILAAQARRMLQDSRLRRFATEFAGNWLEFRRFEDHNAVDRERYPSFDNVLRTAMFEEPVRFFTDLVAHDRSILELLYADHTFVNAALAQHYGMPHPALGGEPGRAGADDWIRIDHAGQYGRGGLLPMGVFLTANSPGLRTSPVKRGYWLVRRVLGERIPPPPPEVPNIPNDEKNFGELTLRETLARHRADQSCAACHARFDSFGLVFEGYGAVGERRTMDFGGNPVDTRADFPGGGSGDGLTGLRDYVRVQREADFVENFCRKLLAYALGRTLLPSDDALIAEMRVRLDANGHRFGTLIEAIVTSRQFLNQRATSAGSPLAAAASIAPSAGPGGSRP